jgi:hypothetical protein
METEIKDATRVGRGSFLELIPGMPGHDERWDIRDLEHAQKLLPLRDKTLSAAIAGLKRVHPDLTKDELFALASTDVFVEKAQSVLTRRSSQMILSGILATAATSVILIYAIVQVLSQTSLSAEKLTWPLVTVRLFQTTALGAFLLIGVKLLVHLSRSFFHEGLALLERRHAMRFGRLYVYLAKGKVDLRKLEAAFHWNKETRTSFLDMKPELVAETLLHKAFGEVGKLPPSIIKALAGTARRSLRKRTGDLAT